MVRSLESQWRESNRGLRALEGVLGKETMDRFAALSPAAQDVVLRELAGSEASIKENPHEFRSMLDALISAYQDIRGAHGEPESRLVYSTGESDADVSRLWEERTRTVITGLEKRRADNRRKL
jgi:hypothetical protein